MTGHTESPNTPFPGKEVPLRDKVQILKLFLSRYRIFPDGEIPINIPTACLVDGEIVDATFIVSDAFSQVERVYFFVESGDALENETLHICAPSEAFEYLQSKEPWEDYDICLFDNTLSWCFAISHNDRYVIAHASSITTV